MANNNNNKTLNVPNMRFPEFSGEWKRTTAAEVCFEFKSGKGLKAENISSEGLYPVFGGNGLRGYTNTFNHDGFYVLIGRQGALCGNINITDGQSYITEHAIAVQADSENETKFFQYLFLKMNLGQFSDQSAQPGLAVNKLLKLPFYLPSKQEQLKIANLLALLDERIATQNKIINKLESLIKGLCEQLLNTNRGNMVTISEILSERSEKTTYNNQHEVLSSTVKGIYSQRDYFSKDIASENNVGYKIIHLNDIVLSPQNLWMGNINYNDKFEKGIVSPSYKVYAISNSFDNIYIAYLLKTHRALYTYMFASEQGASIVRRNLNIELFSQLNFRIPSLHEQIKIGNMILSIKRKLENELLQLNNLRLQKDYLLQQMFI